MLVCKAFTIPPCNHSVIEDHLFKGKTPNRVIVAFVDSDSFDRSYNFLPFNFRHMNISEIGLRINGQPIPNSEPVKLKFDEGEYIRPYHALFTGTDIKCLDHGINISKLDFPDDYSIFTFNLALDLEMGEHLNLLKTGTLWIAVQFSKTVSKTTQLLIFSEFQSIIEFDTYHTVFSDIN